MLTLHADLDFKVRFNDSLAVDALPVEAHFRNAFFLVPLLDAFVALEDLCAREVWTRASWVETDILQRDTDSILVSLCVLLSQILVLSWDESAEVVSWSALVENGMRRV